MKALADRLHELAAKWRDEGHRLADPNDLVRRDDGVSRIRAGMLVSCARELDEELKKERALYEQSR